MGSFDVFICNKLSPEELKLEFAFKKLYVGQLNIYLAF